MTAPIFEYVTLVCDGYEFPGFQSVEVRRSMQDAAIAFRLEATWPRYSPQAKAIRNGQQLEIYTQALTGDQKPQPGGGDLLLIGAVDDYEADIGEGPHKSIVLNGRSHARDVVDCPPVLHPTLRSENMDLLGHAQNLLGEFAVVWMTDQALDIIPKIQAAPGEKGFDTIERQARMEGLLLAGQPDGSILITRAGAKRHAGALVEGQPPVNRWSIKISPGSLRSPVVVKGQRATGYGQQNLRQQDTYALANPPPRHRPAHVVLEGDRPGKQLRTRGQWHHLRAMGFSNIVSPRVSTWRDQDGTLWTPGWLMAIQAPSEDIDLDMLLSEVTFRQGRGRDAGTRAEIAFVDPRDLGGATPMGTQDQVMNPGASIDDSADGERPMNPAAYRGEVQLLDDTGPLQLAQLLGYMGQQLTEIYRVQPFGLSANPPAGAHGILLPLRGTPDLATFLGGEHPSYRPTRTPMGGTTLYDQWGNAVSLTQQVETIQHSTKIVLMVGSTIVSITPGRINLGADPAPHAVETTNGPSSVVYSV